MRKPLQRALHYSQLNTKSRKLPATSENIVTLAQKILATSSAITEFCKENGYPQRTFRRGSPNALLPPDAPTKLLAMQRHLRDATTRIQMLSTDDSDFLTVQAIQNNQLACIKWLIHFSILSLIPLDGSISYAEVATAANVPESDLKSIARMVMLINFLSEPSRDQVAHSTTSALFVKNPAMLELATFFTTRSAPMATKMVDSTAAWGSSKARDKSAYKSTAYNIENATDLPIFQHIASKLELRREYGSYMKIQSQGEAMNLRHLVTGFDWGRLSKGLVVDVGGNLGNASIMLATHFPELHFVVQDLPSAIINAKESIRTIPPAIATRITFQEHDFFEPQPLGQVDVFLLRMIIHDWRDQESIRILRHLVKALKPGGRIIIMDTVMPEQGTVSIFEEGILRVRDLTMLQAHNNNERDLAEWAALIAATDGGLKIKKITQPFGSVMAVIELAYEPES